MLQPHNRSVLKLNCVAQFSMTMLHASSNTFVVRKIDFARTGDVVTWTPLRAVWTFDSFLHRSSMLREQNAEKTRYDLLSIHNNIRSKSNILNLPQTARRMEKTPHWTTLEISIEIPWKVANWIIDRNDNWLSAAIDWILRRDYTCARLSRQKDWEWIERISVNWSPFILIFHNSFTWNSIGKWKKCPMRMLVPGARLFHNRKLFHSSLRLW